MQTNKKIGVLGLMSGTSLDGLDLAFCEFESKNGSWKYKILYAKTQPYSSEWIEKLTSLPFLSASKFVETDHNFGHLLGKEAKEFCDEIGITPDFISSHGHTIFHQPHLGFTSQIGHGAGISAESGLPVIYDFRSLDVALGGQGAPLVPVGDQLLFQQFSFCLNLGGIANISFEHDGSRYAFDICPVNQVLNLLANKLGKAYDANGDLAKTGTINKDLLETLNGLDFYSAHFPKSLGREWVEEKILPLLLQSNLAEKDLLATFTEHIACQIAKTVLENNKNPLEKTLLVTGGGAHNTFLIERLRFHLDNKIVLHIPDDLTINFKEALIFAFLGVLRASNIANCLKDVTGAKNDSIGGAMIGDFRNFYSKISEK